MGRERVELHPDGVAVWFDPGKSAVSAFGDLRPGVEYVVSPEEAQRLVTHKGFEFVDAADTPAGDAPAKPRRARGSTQE